MYNLVSKFKPSGDQPKAIEELVKGIKEEKKNQVLLGATGTGKTFTVANVIKEIFKPTIFKLDYHIETKKRYINEKDKALEYIMKICDKSFLQGGHYGRV